MRLYEYIAPGIGNGMGGIQYDAIRIVIDEFVGSGNSALRQWVFRNCVTVAVVQREIAAEERERGGNG